MHYAAKNGDIQTIMLLACYGANVQQKDVHCETPLHLAALRGHLEAVEMLLRLGAIEEANLDGEFPQDVARKYGYSQIAKFLSEFSQKRNRHAKCEQNGFLKDFHTREIGCN